LEKVILGPSRTHLLVSRLQQEGKRKKNTRQKETTERNRTENLYFHQKKRSGSTLVKIDSEFPNHS